MIHCEESKVRTKGDKLQIMYDVALIMRAVGYEEGLISKEKMHDMVETSFLTDEEIREQALEIANERIANLDRMMELLTKIKKLEKKLKDGDCDCETCEVKDECKTFHESAKNDESFEDLFDRLFKDIKGDE